MRLLRGLVVALLAGGTLAAGAATVSRKGAESIDHPQGISLRQESANAPRGHGFFYMHSRRSHYGGGISRGK